jgi:hypothetical protein
MRNGLLPHGNSAFTLSDCLPVCALDAGTRLSLVIVMGSWRVLKKPAYCFRSVRPRLIGPNHLGPLSTPASIRSSSSTASTGAALASVALGGALLGLGGYYIGARSNNIGVDVAIARALESPPPRKPVYGTPEDFSRAIEELRASFARDAVTTEPDQLAAHGFSTNTHHSGMRALLCISKRAMRRAVVLSAPA